MPRFTVEVSSSPIQNDDWTLLRSVTDAIPGTLLIEDSEEPRLLVPVDAESPMQAATFVEGVSQLMGFDVIRGAIDLADDDFDEPEVDDDEADQTTTEIAVQRWVNGIPPIRGTAPSTGSLVDA